MTVTFLVATLHLAVSVGRSVRHISEFRAVFALLLLPNRPRLDCRVSGLVLRKIKKEFFSIFLQFYIGSIKKCIDVCLSMQIQESI